MTEHKNMTDLTKMVAELLVLNRIYEAMDTIKKNPTKYPEFDFWVPGYDAKCWSEKAVCDFDSIVGGELVYAPAIFKLVTMRHYRMMAKKWRKEGNGCKIYSPEFAEALVMQVKTSHPEFFKSE